jgi:predicted permease
VLALFAGVAGLALSFAGLRWLAAMGPDSVPRLGEVGIDGRVLAFTAAVSLFASLLFGIIPVLKQARQRIVDALKEGSHGSGMGRGRHRARNALVGAQVALALVLLIASGLMIRSFARLRAVDPGFVADDVFTVAISLPAAEYPEDADAARFFQELLDQVAALPGVESAGAVTGVPLSDFRTASGLWIDDHPMQEGELPPVPETMTTSSGYFRTMGIPILRGRSFERADHEMRTGAVVISESLAKHYWPGESALGKIVRPEEEASAYEIVGVVGDVRHVSLTEEPREMIYFPMLGVADDEINNAREMVLTVRSPLPTSSLAPAVRRAIWDLDPNLPIVSRSMNEILDTAMAPTSFAMMMLGIAAAVALLLGAIGVYGVISYIVSQRTREIGIRMALGARSADVQRMVVRQGLIVTLLGVGVGILGALALTRLMRSLLFEVSPTDLLTYAIVAPALVLVATLATWLPAHRAASVSPSEALRSE